MQNRLLSLLRRLPGRRIAVLGDFLLDEFVFGEISRVSREAPVLILRYREAQSCPGGGANTVANVAALGASVYPLGILGGDPYAQQLLRLWPAPVDVRFLVHDQTLSTTRKSRILAGARHSFRQQVVRMDYEHPIPPDTAREDRLIESVTRAVTQVEGLIISDYSLGAVPPRVGAAAVAAARNSGIPVVVDSRDHPARFAGATAVTPNIAEVEAALGRVIGPEAETLDRLGDEAVRRFGVDALLVTRGKWGMTLFSADATRHIPAWGIAEAVDVTGAGDTVAAVFATALAAGASFEDAALLANLAGGIVVAKKGTATVSPEELEEAVRDAFPDQ